MAAQEYYNPSDTAELPNFPPPQYQPHPQVPPQWNSNPPAPQYLEHGFKPEYPHDQYEAAALRPPAPYRHGRHSPPPQQHYQHSQPQQYRPPSPPHSQYQPSPPQKYQQAYQQPYPYPQAPPHQQYIPAYPPRLRPVFPQRSFSEPPSPREPHHHHHHHHRSRSSSRSLDRDSDTRSITPKRPHTSNAKKARGHSSSNTFLGALGGGVIGDLIFPGLGTLGGAIIGAWGGHEASGKKGRSASHSGTLGGRGRKRDRYDVEYEEGMRRRGEI